jgi:GT2 family glycosyltransferase
MIARLFQLWTRLRYRSTPLRLAAEPQIREFPGGPVDEGVRWLGDVRIGGHTHHALFAHPDSRVVYRVPASKADRIVARCALVPDVWDKNRGGVDFDLSVTNGDGGRTARASMRVNPSTRGGRQWRTMSVPVSRTEGSAKQSTGRDLTIELRTRVPPRGSSAHAWAIWGEPTLATRRPLTELVHTAAIAVRRYGWRGAVDRLRQYGTAPDAAAEYLAWCARHTPDEAALASMTAMARTFPYQPLISIITPIWNTDPRWLHALVESVRRQTYERWELCLGDDASTADETRAALDALRADPRIRIVRLPHNAHISAASNAALAQASGDFVVMLDHDDELTPDALFEVVRFLNDDRAADLIYSDEDKLDLDGRRCDPFFKPDWAPEHFLSCMYTCHLMAVRRTMMEEVGGFRVGYEGAQDYDLVLRIMERTSRIRHIPKILYRWRKLPESTSSDAAAKPWAHDAARRALADHLRRTGQDAEVLPGETPGSFRIRQHITGSPLVSIIIPTRASPTTSLRTCLESLAKTRYPHVEVIVVSDGAHAPDWVTALAIGDRVRWLPLEQWDGFNFSGKINAGAAAARGEHLLLLNDDTEALHDDWLDAMLEHSQRAEVGAVGAKLLYPDGRLQHVGIILGVCGVAAHAFHQQPGSSFGYGASAVGIRNYSAVSAACLMTRRSVFDEVGGFDPQFPIDFNDVDYCLRVRRAGYRVVFTPYARLTHHEQASTGRRQPSARDEARFRERWAVVLERDPYYNPNLSRDFADYRLS